MSQTTLDSRHTRKRKGAVEKPATTRQCANERPSSKQTTPPAFYDNLSKLPLCPRVLREIARRTTRPPPPQRPISRKVPPAAYTSLKRFARFGGPSLDNLRSVSRYESYLSYTINYIQYPDSSNDVRPRRGTRPDSSGSRTPQTSRSRSRTGGSSAYDPSFEQHLVDHGIYPHGYDHDDEAVSVFPGNLDDMNDVLAQSRASLSPSKFTVEDFRKFEKSNDQARTEAVVMSTAFQTIVGKNNIPNQQNLRFANTEGLTDGTTIDPQPGFYDGTRSQDIKKSIRDELGDYIVPSTNSTNPALPNFFAEGKGPKGNASVCKLQACYDAAFGARAMYKLRSYVDPDTAVDGNAYTISATYNGGSGSGFLTLYATHAAISKDPERPVDYYMTKLRSFAMTDHHDTFRQGASALRNAREWAQEQRTTLVTTANAKASTVPAAPVPAHPGTTSRSTTERQDPDTLTDEPAVEPRLHEVSSTCSLSSSSRSRTPSTARKAKRRRSTEHD